ncbi:MAG: bifunctional DNA primase/polymerase [Armatimonadota bacterium]
MKTPSEPSKSDNLGVSQEAVAVTDVSTEGSPPPLPEPVVEPAHASTRRALEYIGAGLSVIPLRVDLSKAPVCLWAAFQNRTATGDEAEKLFPGKAIGIVGGRISGNLEVLDFDYPGAFAEWSSFCQDHGISDLVDTLPRVQTPRDPQCFHVYYRCQQAVDGPQVLARLQTPYTDKWGDKHDVKIETRGEGSYVVAPGSPDETHREGKPYVLASGDLLNIPVITAEQRKELLDFARLLNEVPDIATSKTDLAAGRTGQGLKPGDDFNQRGEVLPLLLAEGWQLAKESHPYMLLTRPGKAIRAGYSASYHTQWRIFTCFTSSTAFEQRSYDPFGVYARVKHGADFAAATRELGEQGYGDQTQRNGNSGGGSGQSLARSMGEVNGLSDTDRQVIIETNNRELKEKSSKALEALVKANDPEHVFVFGGMLTRIQKDEHNIQCTAPLSVPMLRYHLERSAKWISTSSMPKKDGKLRKIVRTVAPPKEVVEDLLAFEEWDGVPVLRGISSAPLVAEDGTIMTTPGFNRAAGIYYAPESSRPIPDITPNEANIRWANEIIFNQMIADFPFVDDASKAHAVALLLMPFVRLLIKGQTPIHLIQAPTSGTGKTLLCEALLSPFYPGKLPALGEPLREEDFKKELTSHLKNLPSHTLIDNMKLCLTSGTLAKAVTLPFHRDRLLGGNNMTNIPVNCAWIITANNPMMDKDMARRMVSIELDAMAENPADSNRRFQVPNLEEWLPGQSHNITAACLILINSWLKAGRPEWTGEPMGSFESWSRIMGGILTTIGIAGFLENLSSVRDKTDPEQEMWRAFVQRWYNTEGYRPEAGTADLYPMAVEDDMLIPLMKSDSVQGQKTKLGEVLRSKLGTVIRVDEMEPGSPDTIARSVNVRIVKVKDAKRLARYGLVEVVRDSELANQPQRDVYV